MHKYTRLSSRMTNQCLYIHSIAVAMRKKLDLNDSVPISH